MSPASPATGTVPLPPIPCDEADQTDRGERRNDAARSSGAEEHLPDAGERVAWAKWDELPPEGEEGARCVFFSSFRPSHAAHALNGTDESSSSATRTAALLPGTVPLSIPGSNSSTSPLSKPPSTAPFGGSSLAVLERLRARPFSLRPFPRPLPTLTTPTALFLSFPHRLPPRLLPHLEPPPSLYTPSAPIASSITSPSPVSLIASLQTLVTSSFPPPPPPLFISTPPSTFIRTSPRRSPTSPALPSTAAHPSLTSEREDDFSPTQRIDLSPQLDSTVLPLVQELGYSLIEVSSTRTLRQTDRRRMAARRTTSGSPPMLLKQVEKSRGGSERA
jgi:hypothetical protein